MLKWLRKLFGESSPTHSATNLSSDASSVLAEAKYAAGDFGLPSGKSINPDWDNYQEDYPPDWESRRQAVLKRDNYICQAAGCIRAGSHLHAHHKKPRWQGGNNKLENLVALCPVHHAIVHLDTNKIEVNNIPTCSIVSRYVYWRRNRKVEVPIHIRRHVLISREELIAVRERFQLKCECGSKSWKYHLRKSFFGHRALIWTWCPQCNGRWEFEQGLLEETSSQIAAAFPPSENINPFQFDLNLIQGLKGAVSFAGCPECERHGRRGYLKQKKGVFGTFTGCSEWPVCRYPKTTPVQTD